MARKPTDYVQFKLRIRESLRRKIEKAAEKKATSANAEAVERIEHSFQQEEAHEAWRRDMERRADQIDEEIRRKAEEQAEREADYKAAVRDSRLLTLMVGDDVNADLLRAFVRQIPRQHGWAATSAARKAFAEKIFRSIIDLEIQNEDGSHPILLGYYDEETVEQLAKDDEK
ncbi:Arc family DNA-binding protein [Bradyrhizobium sp. BWC-3-1]|uniref:Arc family DNA-binding protein n=1 Tax=Bradyrhizobium sp. BWC-3-1 TaxID=3080012 RepID=UPI00293F0BB5|nr:Arc family DNA-binding protein [Bradyrhizobium sp. BWC-3-1]WOH55140.1 Arc family DNA-binding protein [Bradyrhizobium sp. BWC-3-1]